MKKLFSIFYGKVDAIEKESYRFNIGFWKSIGLVLLWLLTTTIVDLIATLASYNNNSTYLILTSILKLLTLPIIISLLVKVFGVKTFEKNTFKKVTIKKLIYLALLIFCFRMLYNSFLLPFINKIPVNETIEESFEMMSSSILYLFLSACICAPIIEEVVMRGIMLNGFLNRFNPSFSIFLSSLIFAIVHLNVPQGINAFILGCIIGYVFYKTKSLYLCMFCHFVNNTLAILMPIFDSSSFMSFFIINVISLIICIPIIILIKRNLTLEYKQCLEDTDITTLEQPIYTQNYYGIHYENNDDNFQQ